MSNKDIFLGNFPSSLRRQRTSNRFPRRNKEIKSFNKISKFSIRQSTSSICRVCRAVTKGSFSVCRRTREALYRFRTIVRVFLLRAIDRNTKQGSQLKWNPCIISCCFIIVSRDPSARILPFNARSTPDDEDTDATFK